MSQKVAKPAANKKRRLQEVAAEFANVLAAKPLPSEQKSLQQLEDESLFRHDVEGSDEAVNAAASKRATAEKPKKTSSKKRLHTSTLQKVNELAQKALPKADQKLSPSEVLPDYTKPVLRDFWAAGEGGLPPATALATRELSGKNPAQVLNEWNIGSTQRISAKKTRTVHESNKKQKSRALVPLAGVSYNPAAEDHMQALVRLHEIQTVKNKEVEKRKADKERLVKLHAEVRAREANADSKADEDDDHESDASSVDIHFPQPSERKTKAQRHREQKMKKMQLEKVQETREKKLVSDLNRLKSIVKEVEQTEKEREERAEKRKAALKTAVEKPIVKINGKKIPVENMLGQNPVPEVLPPSQLPDKMRTIPGVGGVIEDQYLKMRMQNVVETGRPKARGRKEAKLKKVRTVDKFNLEEISKRVAQPRFKVPAKLQKLASAS